MTLERERAKLLAELERVRRRLLEIDAELGAPVLEGHILEVLDDQ